MPSPVAQALIHFVGIVAFTRQPAVLPDYANQARFAAVRTIDAVPVRLVGPVVAILPPVPSSMPKHTAMIAFYSCDYLGSTAWNPIDLARDEMLYVPLNEREHVTFQTGVNNPSLTIPAGLPHIPGTDLKAGYKPPGYAMASAVIEFPGGRSMSACHSRRATRRVDTEIVLDNNGALIIAAGSKRLKLKGSATLYIANVPLGYAEHPYTDSGLDHDFIAYCAMSATENVACQPSPMNPSLAQCAFGTDALKVGWTAGHPPPPPPEPNFLTGFECSNTQFP